VKRLTRKWIFLHFRWLHPLERRLYYPSAALSGGVGIFTERVAPEGGRGLGLCLENCIARTQPNAQPRFDEVVKNAERVGTLKFLKPSIQPDRFGGTGETSMEGLILAQDERWRRA
jgi:hypothetical protein